MQIRKKILIVDDDPDIVETIRMLLEHEGYEVFTAYEGIRAIERTRKLRPDLILLDMKMPAGNGNTVVQSLRSYPDTRRVPILVVTGMEKPNLEQEVKAAGAQDLIRKPFALDFLLEKVRFHLHGTSSERTAEVVRLFNR